MTCPIQSGSNRILRLMDRSYNTEDLTKTLLELRRVNPGLFIRTHVIVGFPSETKADLLDTLNLIKRIRFNEVTLYSFSDGDDTVASKTGKQIDETEKLERQRSAIKFFEKEGIGYSCDEFPGHIYSTVDPQTRL